MGSITVSRVFVPVQGAPPPELFSLAPTSRDSRDTVLHQPPPEELPFAAQVGTYADRIRNGEIGDLGSVLEIGRLARGIITVNREYLDEKTTIHMGVDGVPVLDEDAELVLRMGSLDAWVVTQEDATDPHAQRHPSAEQFLLVQRSFEGKTDEFDMSIPLAVESEEDTRMVVEQVGPLRELVGRELGIASPARFTLDALAQKIGQRLALSEQIVAWQTGGVVALVSAAQPEGADAAAEPAELVAADDDIVDVGNEQPGLALVGSDVEDPAPVVEAGAVDVPEHVSASRELAVWTGVQVPLPAVLLAESSEAEAAVVPRPRLPVSKDRNIFDRSIPRSGDEHPIRSHRAERRHPRLRRLAYALGALTVVGATAAMFYLIARGMMPWQPGAEVAAPPDTGSVTTLIPPVETLPEVPVEVPQVPAINLDQHVWSVAHEVAPGQEFRLIEEGIQIANSQGGHYTLEWIPEAGNYQVRYDGHSMVGDQRHVLNKIIASLAAAPHSGTNV